MRKFLQVNLICVMVLLAFFPTEASHAESPEDGCGQMTFHIFTVKENDESIKGQAESGSEIELEIGYHKDAASTDDHGDFEFNIESLQLSEADTVVLINDHHEIESEVSGPDAEEVKIESVLQGECDISEELDEEVLEDESEEKQEIVEEVPEAVEEEAQKAKREEDRMTTEEVPEDVNEKTGETSVEEQPESQDQAVDEAGETEEETDQEDSEKEAEEVLEKESDSVEGDSHEETYHTEDLEIVKDESPEGESEKSTDNEKTSNFSITSHDAAGSEHVGCQKHNHPQDNLMTESCLQAELKGGMLELIYSGWGELRKSNPNDEDKYINFYLPQGISEWKGLNSIKVDYLVPEDGQSGKIKEGSIEKRYISFNEASNHIHININSILHNSRQHHDRLYQFTMNIDLQSLPKTKDGQLVFHAQASEGERGRSSFDGIPKTVLDVPMLGKLAFHNVPDNMDFETTAIVDAGEEILIPRIEPEWTMSVEDSRNSDNGFKIQVAVENPLTTGDGSHSLKNALVYVDERKERHPLNEEAMSVLSKTTNQNEITDITWEENEGIMIEVNPISAHAETYGTTIDWTLVDGP